MSVGGREARFMEKGAHSRHQRWHSGRWSQDGRWSERVSIPPILTAIGTIVI